MAAYCWFRLHYGGRFRPWHLRGHMGQSDCTSTGYFVGRTQTHAEMTPPAGRVCKRCLKAYHSIIIATEKTSATATIPAEW